MQAHDAEVGKIVSAKDLEKWLSTLIGNMRLSGSMEERDIGLRIRMLSVAIDEREAKHFSKDSLKLAWAEFGDFIPTASQLMAFFDELESRERTEAQRLMAVLDVASKPPAPKAPPVDIERSIELERQRRDRERAELIAAAGIVIPPTPPRGPRESDKAYGIRLAEEAKRQCDIGGRALRRQNQPRAAQPVERMEMAYEAMRKAEAERAAKAAPPDPPPGEDSMVCHGERLANMDPDLTTEDDP